jgi:hypothetical protein
MHGGRSHVPNGTLSQRRLEQINKIVEVAGTWRRRKALDETSLKSAEAFGRFRNNRSGGPC